MGVSAYAARYNSTAYCLFPMGYNVEERTISETSAVNLPINRVLEFLPKAQGATGNKSQHRRAQKHGDPYIEKMNSAS